MSISTFQVDHLWLEHIDGFPGGDSLLVSDGVDQTFFGFVKCCLVCLWVSYLVQNRYIFGVADEKFNKVSARLNFSPKYCRAIAEKSYKTFSLQVP